MNRKNKKKFNSFVTEKEKGGGTESMREERLEEGREGNKTMEYGRKRSIGRN